MPSVNDKELLAKLRLLDSKQDVLTPGAGIAINQNTDTISGTTVTPILNQGYKIASTTGPNGVSADLYAPNPNIVQKTQAEYDALPYNEKINGTAYFITDIPDIKVWIGTETEYNNLPLATKSKNNILFFIREDTV